MTFQFQRERRQSLMNPDTNFYVHKAQEPSEFQAKATVPKPKSAFHPCPQWPADARRYQYEFESWFTPQKCLDFLTPTDLERLVSIQGISHANPLFGPVPFVFWNCSLRHCQVSSIQGNVNSGELSVVSDFVRKNILVASVTECQCHLVTSEACGRRSSVTTLDISPSQAMRSYMKKMKQK